MHAWNICKAWTCPANLLRLCKTRILNNKQIGVVLGIECTLIYTHMHELSVKAQRVSRSLQDLYIGKGDKGLHCCP